MANSDITDDSQHWSILYHYTNYCTPDHNNNIIIWKGPLQHCDEHICHFKTIKNGGYWVSGLGVQLMRLEQCLSNLSGIDHLKIATDDFETKSSNWHMFCPGSRMMKTHHSTEHHTPHKNFSALGEYIRQNHIILSCYHQSGYFLSCSVPAPNSYIILTVYHSNLCLWHF